MIASWKGKSHLSSKLKKNHKFYFFEEGINFSFLFHISQIFQYEKKIYIKPTILLNITYRRICSRKVHCKCNKGGWVINKLVILFSKNLKKYYLTFNEEQSIYFSLKIWTSSLYRALLFSFKGGNYRLNMAMTIVSSYNKYMTGLCIEIVTTVTLVRCYPDHIHGT